MIAFPLTVLLALPGPVAGAAASDDGAEQTSLAAAVEQFNEEAAESPVGRTQPPLTTDEVVAAIRGWIPEEGSVSDARFEQYQQIAETGTLPSGANLHSNTRWTGYRGYEFTVWWIDLRIRDAEGGGYNLRLRDRKLSSRKLTEKELADLERNRERSRSRAPDRDAAPVD